MLISIIAAFLSVTIFLSIPEIDNLFGIEYYARSIPWACNYSYFDEVQNENTRSCHVWNTIEGRNLFNESTVDLGGNKLTKLPLASSVDMLRPEEVEVWKSKVKSPSIPNNRYDNVGEPSFASNGSLIFYTGNHYAARGKIGEGWQYVDPYIDFKGVEPANFSGTRPFDLFWADQHTEYDENYDMYTWIRQGKVSLHNGWIANIDRIAVSKNTINWTVYDVLSTLVLRDAGIIEGFFDYPETVIANGFLYITTSVFNNDVNPMRVYGAIFRIAIDDLNSELQPSDPVLESASPKDLRYELVLDRNVTAITPVDGASDPMYFGAHVPSNVSAMKIYEWPTNTNIPTARMVSITPWNSINNKDICVPSSVDWWCKAKTSSRIRSAVLLNNTVNFWWNALTTYDKGTTWIPFIDSASFVLDKNLAYERKYYLSTQSTPWLFGAAASNKNSAVGIGAYYVDSRNSDSRQRPYLNFAFGLFNDTSNKWNMIPVINSSAPLPILNETSARDYNFGDFLTTRMHSGGDNKFQWDIGAYVIVGGRYSDVDPYFIMAN
jgi:hypothetical protein